MLLSRLKEDKFALTFPYGISRIALYELASDIRFMMDEEGCGNMLGWYQSEKIQHSKPHFFSFTPYHLYYIVTSDGKVWEEDVNAEELTMKSSLLKADYIPYPDLNLEKSAKEQTLFNG